MAPANSRRFLEYPGLCPQFTPLPEAPECTTLKNPYFPAAKGAWPCATTHPCCGTKGSGSACPPPTGTARSPRSAWSCGRSAPPGRDTSRTCSTARRAPRPMSAVAWPYRTALTIPASTSRAPLSSFCNSRRASTGAAKRRGCASGSRPPGTSRSGSSARSRASSWTSIRPSNSMTPPTRRASYGFWAASPEDPARLDNQGKGGKSGGMSDVQRAISLNLRSRLSPARDARPAWLPVWSAAAALRALRTVLVVPGLFALTYEVIGDLQLATFAAFGGFATLVMAAFGGTRRDKLVARLGLAVAGSVLLALGTAVCLSAVLTVVVTLPAVFAVFFAGVIGPNAASGGTAALLAYVLPAATSGTIAMIPSRLAGWWLASAAGTLAVLLLSPRPADDRLRAAAATCGDALAGRLDAALRGEAAAELGEASVQAERELLSAFTATPYRLTGLATTDQALDNLVGLLEWCTAVVTESLGEYRDLSAIPPVERDLLAATAGTLRSLAAVLAGEQATPDLECLRRRLADGVARRRGRGGGEDRYRDAVHLSFHARTLALATHQAAEDALIAMRRADPDIIVGRRRRWYGLAGDPPAV